MTSSPPSTQSKAKILRQINNQQHDSHNVHLILHIPMAPSDSLLQLYQLLLFPLLFTDMHMLMPSPPNQILAISATTDRLSVKLSAVHLLCCHRVNQVYLCEQSGVLKRNLNDTCLGLLYMQDLQGAMTLCKMIIIPVAKMVLQLHDNWYIIHSPQLLTSRIDCINSSVSEVFICRGANRVHVSPSCCLQVRSHVLISNFAVQLDTVIKHYEWELGQISFSAKEQAHSEEWLTAIEDNVGRSTLTTIRHSLAVEKRLSVWSFLFSLLAVIIIVALSVFLGYVILTQHFLTLR
jgi:hypothetical protein